MDIAVKYGSTLTILVTSEVLTHCVHAVLLKLVSQNDLVLEATLSKHKLYNEHSY